MTDTIDRLRAQIQTRQTSGNVEVAAIEELQRNRAAIADLVGLLKDLIDLEGPQPGNIEWANKVSAAITKHTTTTKEGN